MTQRVNYYTENGNAVAAILPMAFVEWEFLAGRVDSSTTTI